MEEVKELKDMLERVERKLIAAQYMYGAMWFTAFLVAMGLYYVLGAILGFSGIFSAIYWIGAFVFIGWIGTMIGKRLEALLRAQEKREGSSYSPIFLSWIVGAIIGWGIVPRLNLGITEEASVAAGSLTFIFLGVFGMWLTSIKAGIVDKAMIPAYLLPALGIPIVLGMEKGAIIWAGFLVTTGYALTSLLYLYFAFKVIER